MSEEISTCLDCGGDMSRNDALRDLACPECLEKDEAARFKNVFCSQCGETFGPGDHGYSHCTDHAGINTTLDAHSAR